MGQCNSSDRKNKYSQVDLWLLKDNQNLSYEERVTQHQNTLDCIESLKLIRKESAKSPKTSRVSSQKSS